MTIFHSVMQENMNFSSKRIQYYDIYYLAFTLVSILVFAKMYHYFTNDGILRWIEVHNFSYFCEEMNKHSTVKNNSRFMILNRKMFILYLWLKR